MSDSESIAEFIHDAGTLTINSAFERTYAEAYSRAIRHGLSREHARFHAREMAQRHLPIQADTVRTAEQVLSDYRGDAGRN